MLEQVFDLLSHAFVTCHCRIFTMATAPSRLFTVIPVSSTFPFIATMMETSSLAVELLRRYTDTNTNTHTHSHRVILFANLYLCRWDQVRAMDLM